MLICDRRFLILPFLFWLQIRLWVMPAILGKSMTAATIFLDTFVIFQYGPKLWILIPIIVGETPTGLLIKPALANFVRNLLTFMLAGQLVGTLWYSFGLEVWPKSQN